MYDFRQLSDQVEELEYRLQNVANKNNDVLRKIIDKFSQSVTETFNCVARRGKIDIEVYTSGAITKIECKVNDVLIASNNGAFLSACAQGLAVGAHKITVDITAPSGGNGAMIVCYSAM